MAEPGERNRLVEFQRSTIVTDDFGGETETWAAWCSEWAAVNFGTGQERRDAAQEAGSIPATVQVLRNAKTAALTIKDQMSLDGAAWDLISIVPSREFNAGIDITAVRAAA